jgi:hypothetical protein
MWSSDYPHGASTWPRSREVVDRDHAALDQTDVRALTWDNCAALYGIDLDEVSEPSPVISAGVGQRPNR